MEIKPGKSEPVVIVAVVGNKSNFALVNGVENVAGLFVAEFGGWRQFPVTLQYKPESRIVPTPLHPIHVNTRNVADFHITLPVSNVKNLNPSTTPRIC
jgi:hypothetical protein